MKKTIIVGTSIVAILIGIFILNFEEIQYSTTVNAFEEITVEELDKLQSSEDIVHLYIGRKTCPYCRNFVPKLRAVGRDLDVKIYYIDSEDSENQSLTDFRNNNEIRTVPALLNVKNNNTEAVMDSTLTEEDIANFLNQKY